MKKTVSTSFAVALVALWGIAAQGQEAPRPAQPTDAAPSQQAPAPAPAPEQAPAPAPERGAAAAEEVTIAGCLARADAAFRLNDAKAAAGAAASAPKVEDEYALVAGSGVTLAPHVDHQVEVTGRAAAAPGGTPSFTVTAVRMIADKCE